MIRKFHHQENTKLTEIITMKTKMSPNILIISYLIWIMKAKMKKISKMNCF